jgi:C1A family cysteine protease
MDSPKCPTNKKYPIKIIHLDKSKLNYAKDFKPTNKICAGLCLPTKVDLREPNNNSPNKIMPPVYDQGSLGSCTANALCAAMQYNNINIQGSRLFVYFNGRMIRNTIGEDAGAFITDGIDALKIYGVCQEEEWPYNKKKYKQRPTDACYINALAHRAIKVENIAQNLYTMKKALWSGYPIILAMEIFASFMSKKVKKSGIVSMSDVNTDLSNGGHAILVVGYDDEFSIDNIKGCWICRNSHGTNWGDNGYFRIPYKYLLDESLTTDLWIILEST